MLSWTGSWIWSSPVLQNWLLQLQQSLLQQSSCLADKTKEANYIHPLQQELIVPMMGQVYLREWPSWERNFKAKLKNNKPKPTSFTPCWDARRVQVCERPKDETPKSKKPCRWGSGAGSCGGIEGAVWGAALPPLLNPLCTALTLCHLHGRNTPPSRTLEI